MSFRNPLKAAGEATSWSMASRLVLLFSIAAALLMLGTLAGSLWIVVKHLNTDSDRFLFDKLAKVTSDLTDSDGEPSLRAELSTYRGPDKSSFQIRIMNAMGKVIAQTPHIDKKIPREVFPVVPAPAGRPKTTRYINKDRTYALITKHVNTPHGSYILQMGQDRTLDSRFATRLSILLSLLLVCAILTCAGMAFFVTWRELRPLKELAESVQGIGVTELHQRLPAEGWPTELQPLATAFNRMLARLEASFTRLSQFSADLAHELRTPIAILRGEAEAALTKARSGDELREVIESSLEELQRLSGMIDNLLFLARAETTGQLKKQSLDGRAAIEELREFCEIMAHEQGVEIHCEGEGTIFAEPSLFRRAMINLISNAMRFTPRGGRISISLLAEPHQTAVVVSDNGCGIAGDHLSKIFDRFFRGNAPRSAQGSGLGLSIVKSIMEVHNGSVDVQSTLGEGTSVTLTFPSTQKAPAPSAKTARQKTSLPIGAHSAAAS